MTYQTAHKYVKKARVLGIESYKDTVDDSDTYLVAFLHEASHVSTTTAREARTFLKNFERCGRFFG